MSQPIGLIPSQDKGSPELSYVSELDKNTHRTNLVAEKAFGLFRSKNTFLAKNTHCAYVGARPQFFFSQKSDFSIIGDMFRRLFNDL